MDCNVIKDLIPLYIDGCCSKGSEVLVEEHVKNCPSCKKMLEDMQAPDQIPPMSEVPVKMSKLNDWKASILQSVLLFISFALITLGVSLEAKTPSGLLNGYWAVNLVIPATGFMMSLANWYFIRLYTSRKAFSICSLSSTFVITVLGWVWAVFHYEINIFEIFEWCDLTVVFEIILGCLLLNVIGIILAAVFCILSKVLSNRYALMLGKE